MPHRVIQDPQIFPRMNRDMDRHNKKLREAIKKNLSEIISKQDIITSKRDKKIRVPIKQLKTWEFYYDPEKRPHVAHGDAVQRITCPECNGAGCGNCGDLGTITQRQAKKIKFIKDLLNSPLEIENIDLLSNSLFDEIEKRKGKSGKPRTLKNDKIGIKDKEGAGQGGGGDEMGTDEYETEISIAELEDIMFEALELPNLEDRGEKKIQSDEVIFNEIRKTGPLSSIEKKKTVKANIMRNAKEKGQAYFGDLEKDDLRFRRWNIEEKNESAAVIFAIMDVSGSMTEHKKFIARSFYHWMKKFLETQYISVEIVFIAHHTEAKEVSEDEFFHKKESGGTFMSSGWKKANDIIKGRYPISDWNVYIFHFSDGENWSQDNDILIKEIQESLSLQVNMIGYGEILDTASSFLSYKNLPFWANSHSIKDILKEKFEKEEKFVICEISEEKEVWQALKKFFSKTHGKQLRKLSQEE